MGEVVDSGAVPDDLQAWLVLGGLAQRLGDAALTEHIVDGVIERFPDEPRVALLRASQLREADRPDQAREVLATLAAAGTRSDEHPSELQSLMRTSYAVLCLKKKQQKITTYKK